MEFTDNEIDRIRVSLNERYEKAIKINLVDGSQRSENGNQNTGIYWHMAGVNYLITKTGEKEYSGGFYSTPHNFHDGQKKIHNNVEQCIEDIIQTQRSLDN